MRHSTSLPTSVDAWLAVAAAQLRTAGIASSRLDSELLLSHVLQRPRHWLHAHGDSTLLHEQQVQAEQLLTRRLRHEPLAYLVGHKEFYGRDFVVSPAVLVPRPETEQMIILLLQLIQPTQRTIADVGTGSGILAITAQLELPQCQVNAYDISLEALAIAQHNAQQHGATSVHFIQSDLLVAAQQRYDVILANLPYVNPTWRRDDCETAHEPARALFAEDDGLALISTLLAQTEQWLAPSSLLILEADPCQHSRIITRAAAHQLTHVRSEGYALAFTK
ncbi:MAG: peptide chain release factor N(5)-glutamine methyltransferase [Candidatus Saccharibacteria bacterium]|nr:peptide chain release factor N(5)-glutamine methyltransferase [Candidatus Saccharibacteria bacterium]